MWLSMMTRHSLVWLEIQIGTRCYMQICVHQKSDTFFQSIPQVDFLSWESISNIVNIMHRFHFHLPVVIAPVLRPSFVRTRSFQWMENESWHGTSLSQVATVCMTHGALADAPVRYSNHWCNQCRTRPRLEMVSGVSVSHKSCITTIELRITTIGL